MSAFTTFLEGLFAEGAARLCDRPQPSAQDCAAAGVLLDRVFYDYRLEVAGPLLNYDTALGVAAAEVVWHACWFLVNHQDPPEELERKLGMPNPTTPATHLTVDLVFRYLPQIHRRARAIDPADRLTSLLTKLLCQWPLSGVLSDVDDVPTTPLDFGGHPGLLLLYAERWTRNDKPAWRPGGIGAEYLELCHEASSIGH